jgi:uncharacterized protein YcnI
MTSRTTTPTDASTLTMLVGAALLVLFVVATPASAHPFIVGGGRVPVQSLATIELDLAHGCDDERAGQGLDTDEVALEVPTWLRIVDVPVPDGWTVEIEAPMSTSLGVVVWSATTGAEPAPRFALDVVVDGEAGETRSLRVSQRCGDVVERWVGTAEEPAEQPAVRLLLEAADPASPPPPLPGPEPSARPQAQPQPQPEPGPGPGPQPQPQPEPAPATTEAVTGRRGALQLAVGLTVGAGIGIVTVRSRRSHRTRRPR